MENYIPQQMIKYDSVEDLLKNDNKPHSLFDNRDITIKDLLHENFVCIVGEPGIGKSRLVKEIREQISGKETFFSTALKFDSIPEGKEYVIVDALDEVEEDTFYKTLQSIKQYKETSIEVKVFFTCRKHYVASYAKHFLSCKKITYAELSRLTDADVEKGIDSCPENIKDQVLKNSKLRELLTIPRYLTFLLKCTELKGEISNIGELFEFIISESIQTAINSRKGINNSDNTKILIQRTLEKVAFIMEISRKDQISKDELYTILDGIKGNMTQMLIANFDLLFFENRILKDTNGILQFENTEIQEYLAAKELCRQDNIESVLYDISVQKELRHIYPNWYDVLPHISYTKERIHTFINVIKLIISYESNLDNDSFESLLRYVDPSVCEPKQKDELFSILFEHYLRVPAYIRWESQTLRLMRECYSSNCNNKFVEPTGGELNKIQLLNICAILKTIVNEYQLDETVSKYWTSVAKSLIQDENSESQLLALSLYAALKRIQELIELSANYNGFTDGVKEKYCEVTGYGMFTSLKVVDCWLNGCYERNPYALNAVLCIEDSATIYYVYNKIIEKNKLNDFFNPKGKLLVCYDLYLVKQFDIVWDVLPESKLPMTKVIAHYALGHAYSNLAGINPIIKKILLEEETGKIFVGYFSGRWDLVHIFSHFNEELVDAELISTLEKLLHNSKMETWYIDNILTTLINKIRKAEDKKASIAEYITRYAETFERWDNSSSEEIRNSLEDSKLTNSYNDLSKSSILLYTKYEIAFELSKHIDFLRQQDTKPIMSVIEDFLDKIDLDKMVLKKKGENSFSLSLSLIKIPSFVNLIHQLDNWELIERYRIVLTKTLPIICCTTTDFATDDVRNIYKSIIGGISEEEKHELMSWWESREDDFMNSSPESIFTCITDYGIDALSYKLEEYINTYVSQQDNLSCKLTASKALELISKGHLNWNIEQYRNLFNAVGDDSIRSIKMQCNAILIEKFNDSEAIIWRVKYLRENVTESIHNETGHLRPISIAESEMISPSPQMFRCFMDIKDNDILVEQLIDLFDFALTLCVKHETQEYSSYLLKQIYFFFFNTGNINIFSLLRKKVELFNVTHCCYLVNSIMNNAEMMYLQSEKISIGKSIKLYNKCIKESHLEIRNEADLRRYFALVYYEVQKEIQDQGIYALVRQETLSEDFIQRELKNTIMNKCCQMGLETIQVDREVALQDNKRTDFLIRYGMCNPIMVELKLLHNEEIKNKTKREKYIKKFIQYTNATNACLSVFWVFDVHKKGGNKTIFAALKKEYQNLEDTMVLLTDCKCSSGFETGVSSNKRTIPKGAKNKKKNH